MKLRILLVTALLAILSCGPRKKAPASLVRPFPSAEVPLMVSDPLERFQWRSLHFWDRFAAPDSLYHCDSLTVNGVPAQELEAQVGLYVTLLEQLPPQEGIRCVERYFEQISAFQEAHPEGPVFERMEKLLSRYLYDPNSPVRNELLYQPFARRLSTSPFVEATERMRFEREASLCGLNQPGTPATDFHFIDSFGRRRSLYGIDAGLMILIFGNPDCQACRDINAQLSGNQEISALLSSGDLKVVAVYIDQDIERWKEHVAEYPATWISGYDPTYTIRTDLLYHVRAIPSLYLLSANKTVLLKDATPEALFAALGAK